MAPTIEFEGGRAATGWNAPALAPWLERSLAAGLAGQPSASRRPIWARAAPSPSWRCWARSSREAQFVVTGVLGPHSNAHGPNEFLHIPTGKRVTAVVAQVLADHGAAAAAAG